MNPYRTLTFNVWMSGGKNKSVELSEGYPEREKNKARFEGQVDSDAEN